MIDVDAREADALLERLKAAGKLGTVVRQTGEVATQLIRQGFRDQRDPWGNQWAPLSPLTIAARQRRGSASTQPLQDRNVMLGSLKSQASGDEAVISMAGQDRFPGVHQNGNARIPARPMFPIRNGAPDIPSSWFDSLRVPMERHLEALMR